MEKITVQHSKICSKPSHTISLHDSDRKSCNISYLPNVKLIKCTELITSKVYQKNNNAFEMLKMAETCSSTISGSTKLIMFGKCLRTKL